MVKLSSAISNVLAGPTLTGFRTQRTTTAPPEETYPEATYPEDYTDPSAGLIGWDANLSWRSWASQNKTILNEVWNRWEGRDLTDPELMQLASGGPEAESLYETYERFRKFESFRPLFWQYYGAEANRKQIERAVDLWDEPDRMADHISYHRKATEIWMKYYGRKPSSSEVWMLREGKMPNMPTIRWEDQKEIIPKGVK